MHIGFFAPSWPLEAGANGIVTYVAAMRGTLLRAGHRVTVVTPDAVVDADHRTWVEQEQPGLAARLRARLFGPSPAHGAQPLVGAALAQRVRRLHESSAFDLFEMEESFGWAGQLAGRGSMPVIVRLHGPITYGHEEPAGASLPRALLQRCAAEKGAIASAAYVSSPSARMLRRALADFHAAPRLARAIPNPVVPPAEAWRAADAEPGHVLAVGRFDRRKGADILLEAFAKVVAQGLAARLTLVGPNGGLLVNGERLLFEDYARRSLPEALWARVTFLDKQPPAEISRLRRSAALQLLCSRFEVYPYSLAEAMVSGLPVAAADVYGVGEMIEHERTGLLFQADDANSAADALGWALRRPEAMAEMAARARRWAMAKLDPTKVAAESLDFYRAVVEDHSRQARG